MTQTTPTPEVGTTAAVVPSPPEIRDSGYNDGDFVLISSDNYRFRIASYRLFAAR
jgi:hypothetical protein